MMNDEVFESVNEIRTVERKPWHDTQKTLLILRRFPRFENAHDYLRGSTFKKAFLDTYLRSFQAADMRLLPAAGAFLLGVLMSKIASNWAEARSPSLESGWLESARWSATEQPHTSPSRREVEASRFAPCSPVQATSPAMRHVVHHAIV